VKKIFLSIFPLILALVMILPHATTVMADTEQEIKAQPAIRAALIIRAPNTADVGQPVTIKVFERFNQKSAEQASVYAAKVNLVPVPSPSSENGTATQMILAAPTYTTEAEKYAALAKEMGVFIGYTNNAGEVVHTFNEAGLYILVATKDGYSPGFTKINILLSPVKALAVIVPPKAEVNQQVNIKVLERGTHNAVAKAGVYALKIGEISEPKTIPEIIKPEAAGKALAEKYAALTKEKGTFIGWTDDNGTVVHKFGDTGRYIVVAIKDGYEPGFAHIAIMLSVNKTLIIKAPGKANIGESVTISVKEKHTREAVAQADVYALKVGGSGEAIGLIMRAEVRVDSNATENLATAVREKGALIGKIDNNETLVHTFTEAGHYVLIAIKSGYTPDFARIQIKPLKPFKVENPLKINVIQPTNSNSSNTNK